MHGIPYLASELVPARAIPPVVIKLSVGKPGELGKAVADAL